MQKLDKLLKLSFIIKLFFHSFNQAACFRYPEEKKKIYSIVSVVYCGENIDFCRKNEEKQMSQLNLARRLKTAVKHSMTFIEMATLKKNGHALLQSKSTVSDHKAAKFYYFSKYC